MGNDHEEGLDNCTAWQHKLAVVQDPRRYFEQTSTRQPAPLQPAGAESAGLGQLSTVDVLKLIDPRALQSGMDPASARQVMLEDH